MELSRTIRQANKTTAYYYLRSRIKHYLARADEEINPKKRFEFLEKARELARQFRTELEKARGLARQVRSEKGFTPWTAVVFAVVIVAISALWLASRMRATYFYSYPDNYLRIVRNVDPCQADGSCGYRFVVQAVENGVVGPETEMHFCTTIQPHFEAGHILQWIRYTDLGSCQAISGYDIVRKNDRPVYAPNCKPDYSVAVAGHFNCEGGKAKF